MRCFGNSSINLVYHTCFYPSCNHCMMGRKLMGRLQSEPIKVNAGVKQGCVLAPILLNLFLSAITHLFHHAMRHSDGVHLECHLDGSLFNIRRFQAHTKTNTCQIYKLQYADDCAVLAHSPDSVQHALDTISSLYQSFGLYINTKKGHGSVFHPTPLST